MSDHEAALQKLVEKRDRLTKKIADLQDAESTETARGETDNAHEWENADIRDDLSREAESQLASVQAALARVDAGEYGTCAGCGKPIGSKRLEAMPEVTLCIACAERA